GIAVIIATSQIKDLLGFNLEKVPADFLEKIPLLWEARATLNSEALLIGLLSMALIIALRKFFPKFPGLIVAVALSSLAVYVLGLDVDTLHSRFGALPSSLPMPKLPDLSLSHMVELLPSALVIAFLAGVESLLSAMVADKMSNGKHRPNAEILAQGAANIGSSLFGGLPATGAIARTATNIRAGGKTPVAGLVHAVCILLAMMLAASLAGYLAMPALAALLILTAWNMSEPHKWKEYAALPKADLFLLLLTFILTVIADLTIAIGLGVVLGLAIELKRKNAKAQEWQSPEA
ncbi:MAG: sulfate permease, partial [Micavibrio sp.]|nr:sulfate permease [Micavibrio sp.]